MPLKQNDTIVLIFFMVAIFIVFFAWFMNRTCRRVWDAEVLEMQMRREAQADAETRKGGGLDGNENGGGNTGGNGRQGSENGGRNGRQ
jgi:uncharacterized membrane protein YgcG